MITNHTNFDFRKLLIRSNSSDQTLLQLPDNWELDWIGPEFDKKFFYLNMITKIHWKWKKIIWNSNFEQFKNMIKFWWKLWKLYDNRTHNIKLLGIINLIMLTFTCFANLFKSFTMNISLQTKAFSS